MLEFTGEDNLNGTFGQCLQFLLYTHGARPDGSPQKPGKQWGQKEFADLVGVSDRTVRYWLEDKKLPVDLQGVERVLFGTNGKYDDWRKLLRSALQTTKNRGPRQPERSVAPLPDGAVSSHTQIRHPDIRQVPGFIGREAMLETLDARLWQGKGTVAIRNANDAAVAVHGLGGIGKTTVAKQYAWDARDRYHGLWWVRAESRDALLDDLIALGRRLRLDFDETKPEEAALATLDHIAQTPKPKPWLMVYDNVEDKALVRRFTPAENAHLILTTRLPDWLGEAEDLPVDVFPRETAIDYLLAGAPQATREAAGRLADALGCLPLALSHARAFCRARGKSFEAYAGELATRLDTLPKDAAADYPRSVFATFSLAMDRADEDCPAAARLMGLLAHVAPDQIPLWLIPDAVMPEEERDEALEALAGLSLVAREPLADGTPAVSVHRLVQAVMRRRLQQAGEAADYAVQAVTLIDGGFGANDGTMEVERRRAAWLPHALAVLDHAPRDGAAAHDTVWVCNYIGDFRVSRGDLARARQAYDTGLTIAERLAAAEPGHAGWQRDLAVSYERMAICGDNPLENRRRVVEILQRLADAGCLAPVDQPWLDSAREQLAALEGTE